MLWLSHIQITNLFENIGYKKQITDFVKHTHRQIQKLNRINILI